MEYENNQNDISSNHCIPNKREQGKGGGGVETPENPIETTRGVLHYSAFRKIGQSHDWVECVG